MIGPKTGSAFLAGLRDCGANCPARASTGSRCFCQWFLSRVIIGFFMEAVPFTRSSAWFEPVRLMQFARRLDAALARPSGHRPCCADLRERMALGRLSNAGVVAGMQRHPVGVDGRRPHGNDSELARHPQGCLAR